MKQVTLNIQDNKYTFFMELVNSLSFVKKIEPTESESHEQEALNGVKQAIEELKLYKRGKLSPKPLKDLLDEL